MGIPMISVFRYTICVEPSHDRKGFFAYFPPDRNDSWIVEPEVWEPLAPYAVYMQNIISVMLNTKVTDMKRCKWLGT